MKICLFVGTIRGILRASATQNHEKHRGEREGAKLAPSQTGEKVFMNRNCITCWSKSQISKKPRAYHYGRGLLS